MMRQVGSPQYLWQHLSSAVPARTACPRNFAPYSYVLCSLSLISPLHAILCMRNVSAYASDHRVRAWR